MGADGYRSRSSPRSHDWRAARTRAGPVNALVLEDSDDSLDHAVLLGAEGRDELLVQAITFDEGFVTSGGENQSVVR